MRSVRSDTESELDNPAFASDICLRQYLGVLESLGCPWARRSRRSQDARKSEGTTISFMICLTAPPRECEELVPSSSDFCVEVLEGDELGRPRASGMMLHCHSPSQSKAI